MPIACKQSPRDLATTALANNDVTLSINSWRIHTLISMQL